ncbi:hypothetical protein Pmani_015364 [Petrolisthes manimaculis]|uniref:Pro-resilin n=1 Tax=Petrolisthes manimaculis TaxID=1843537 RepID=A0AAE1PUM0_9EUCA|nr:hypothetical protein Pmani_039175 [Petrolisthes manimaculis]KAK4313282.1 hypothetical protein Pmani_015364 [Petrolisthes manimaculis]
MVTVVASRPVTPGYNTQQQQQQQQVPASYDFQYGVRDDYSGNNFGQQESREGLTTQGAYYINLPDGRILKVSYRVTPQSGYVAKVTYEGEAQYL